MASQPQHRQSPAVIEMQLQDDMAALRGRLDRLRNGRVALLLPWDLRFLSRDLDFDLLRREVQRRRLQVAIVSADPARREVARGNGFPTFPSLDEAAEADRWDRPVPKTLEPPPSYWWEEEIDLRPSPVAPRGSRRVPSWLSWFSPELARWATRGARFAAFSVAIVVLAASAYAVAPRAEIALVPAGETLTVRVPVSVDPAVDAVISTEQGGGIIPSRRVGLEVEGHAEVMTTEAATVAAGRATGEVLFTSLLAQDYVVPAGTVVRTSSTSYPIRFRTTAAVVVPAGGQARAPITALDERTGNVGAFQINRVEGVVGSAVRVINPEPTTGAEAQEVPVVVQADYDRVREQLTMELLDEAYTELHGLLEGDEFLPYQSLRVEAVPKKAYSHFIGEQAEAVALNMRLLVSGQAVNAADARALARRALLRDVPSGYDLVEARFEVGEVMDDEEGPGWFTVVVTGEGYAAADIGEDAVIEEVRGMRVPEAEERLAEAFPLGGPPRLTIWPDWPSSLAWLERVPLVPMRVQVAVTPAVPGALQSSDDASSLSSPRGG